MKWGGVIHQIIIGMNLTKDPVLKRRILTMTQEIYDKAVIPASRANSSQLSVAEKKAIDRLVIKYLETAKYTVVSFRNAIKTLREEKN